MDLALLEALNAARANRKAVLLETGLESGAQRLIREAEPQDGPLAAVYAECFRSGKAVRAETENGPVFIAAYLPPPRLIITGAVHISQALAPMAAFAGLDPIIVDPRTGFATEERFPKSRVIAEWPEDALPDIGVDRYTGLAALTHDPKIDDPALQAALSSDCFYIGALGSRKTHGKRVDRLKAQGFSEDKLAGIHAPIGLAIGAASPSEIAVAILAEVVAALRQTGAQR
ncbi:MAG: XdhC family protein [Hyphomicrobiales bacterium]|nr:XdhC family protein [Hyphomicrobiales bacterium]